MVVPEPSVSTREPKMSVKLRKKANAKSGHARRERLWRTRLQLDAARRGAKRHSTLHARGKSQRSRGVVQRRCRGAEAPRGAAMGHARPPAAPRSFRGRNAAAGRRARLGAAARGPRAHATAARAAQPCSAGNHKGCASALGAPGLHGAAGGSADGAGDHEQYVPRIRGAQHLAERHGRRRGKGGRRLHVRRHRGVLLHPHGAALGPPPRRTERASRVKVVRRTTK